MCVLYLEGLFVDVDVVSSFDLFGLAEEDEVLEQEDVTQVFFPPAPDNELVLASELTLFLQIHLRRTQQPISQNSAFHHIPQCTVTTQ